MSDCIAFIENQVFNEDGELHNEFGPALIIRYTSLKFGEEFVSIKKENLWYLNGKAYSYKEWLIKVFDKLPQDRQDELIFNNFLWDSGRKFQLP